MKYCEKCSSILNDEDSVCGNCGTKIPGAQSSSGGDAGAQSSSNPFGASPGSGPSAGPNAGAGGQATPPKYMVPGILSILFCCWPFAIPCLVYTSKIDGLMAQGKVDEAWEASKKSKNWLIASIVIGFVVQVIAIIISVAASAFS